MLLGVSVAEPLTVEQIEDAKERILLQLTWAPDEVPRERAKQLVCELAAECVRLTEQLENVSAQRDYFAEANRHGSENVDEWMRLVREARAEVVQHRTTLAISYPMTPVDCLLSQLREEFFLSKTSVLTLADFEERVAEFQNSIKEETDGAALAGENTP